MNMAKVGGSAKECSIDGRIFTPDAAAEVTIKLGGVVNEVLPNGDGTSRLKQTVTPGAVEGLVVGIDHDQGDLQHLQKVQKGKKFVPFSITLMDDNTYQGEVQITDMPGVNAMSASAELAIMANGEITKQ
jgi:hypothetical protein